MAVLNTYSKQPNDVLDYDLDYSEFLSAGDSLSNLSTAAVSPSGLTVHTPLVIGKTLKIWVQGGSAGVKYKVTVQAVTVLGRTKEDELIFRVKDI